MKQEYHRALEQICLSEEARARIISVLEQKERGLKRPRRRIGRLILVCAVLILLLLGTGAAVVSRVGVLELFFQGDTSQLEPFVQTGASAQDKNYRLTLDSSICDGDTGSRQDAEDVTQTVFLKVLERRPDLEPGKERAWLFWVAVNECRSLWRRLKLRRTEPLEEALAVAAPQEEPVLRQVMELKAGEREILYLIYYEGFSTRETASLLGISQTAVTTRLQRARKKLRERLEEEGRP